MLNGLNRQERQLWKKYFGKKGETMTINLLKPIEAINDDETMIFAKDGKPPTTKELILRALRSPLPGDERTGQKEKHERYLIVKRVTSMDEIELNEGERKLILDRAGRLFLQVELFGKLEEALTPPAAVAEAAS